MKEVVYRDIQGYNPRKREVSIEEISDHTESRIAKKWLSKYFIREFYASDNTKDLDKWIEKKTKQIGSRNCHILRHVDAKTGENKMIRKVMGDFFVIHGMTAFRIVYINEIRIERLSVLRRGKDALKRRF